MRNLFSLPRFVLTVGIAIYVLPAVSLAEDKNTSAANVSSMPLPPPSWSGPWQSAIPGTPTYRATADPNDNPYASCAPATPPATCPYYQAPLTPVPCTPPATGFAPPAYAYTSNPYATNPKEELRSRYAELMGQYAVWLSQDLPEEKFRELVYEAEATVAVARAKHELADAVRTLEMVQKDYPKAKAANDAGRLLTALPQAKDLQLEHGDVPSSSPKSKPNAPEKKKSTSDTSPLDIKKGGSAAPVKVSEKSAASHIAPLEELLAYGSWSTHLQCKRMEKECVGKTFQGVVDVWDVDETDGKVVIKGIVGPLELVNDVKGGYTLKPQLDFRFVVQDPQLKDKAAKFGFFDKVQVTAKLQRLWKEGTNASDSIAEFTDVTSLELEHTSAE